MKKYSCTVIYTKLFFYFNRRAGDMLKLTQLGKLKQHIFLQTLWRELVSRIRLSD